MKNVIKTRSFAAKLLVASTFFALASTAALAQESSTANWSTAYAVGFSDLDVATMKGAKTLYLRIRHAAETVCESAATWGKQDGDACVRKAINDAVARVDVPLLTQYYGLRSKCGKVALLQLAKAN